jgi:hypothetical protein
MVKTIKGALEYEQKSLIFLYPFLNLPKALKPVGTYLFLENFQIENGTNLICLFHNESEEYKENKKSILLSPFYELTIVDHEFDIVIFNFESMADDYNKIVNGNYQDLSTSSKNFLMIKTDYLCVMHALNPSIYYNEYAEYLECDPELLEGHALVMPPEKQNETLVVTKEIRSQ